MLTKFWDDSEFSLFTLLYSISLKHTCKQEKYMPSYEMSSYPCNMLKISQIDWTLQKSSKFEILNIFTEYRVKIKKIKD